MAVPLCLVIFLRVTRACSDALKITIQRSTLPDEEEHRLSWCPVVPQGEGEEEDDTSLTIALSHGTMVSWRVHESA